MEGRKAQSATRICGVLRQSREKVKTAGRLLQGEAGKLKMMDRKQ